MANLLAEAIEAGDVEGVATAIALDVYPTLRRDHVRAALDDLAAQLSHDVFRVRGHARLGRLLRGVYGELSFETPKTYDDPRLHLVSSVIDRREGSPVALAVVLSAVGKRLGIELHGVAFPGHFMVRYEAGQPIFVDPSNGAFPFPADCLRKLASEELRLSEDDTDRFLAPASARTVAVRLLQNLQRSYEERGDRGRSLWVADRMYEITGAASARCDRGLRAAALGAHHLALDDLRAYLRDHEDDSVAKAAARLRLRPHDLH
jgi:regulator of sirC expression with transglutaminase-like and TPR domain